MSAVDERYEQITDAIRALRRVGITAEVRAQLSRQADVAYMAVKSAECDAAVKASIDSSVTAMFNRWAK